MVRRLLAIGVPMGPNVLMTVRGRKSGKAFTFPVATSRRVGASTSSRRSARSSWVQNLRASGEAVIRRGRTNRRMTAVELAPEVAAPLLEAGMQPVLGVPVFGSMIAGWYGLDRSSTAGRLSRRRPRHPGFELTEAA